MTKTKCTTTSCLVILNNIFKRNQIKSLLSLNLGLKSSYIICYVRAGAVFECLAWARENLIQFTLLWLIGSLRKWYLCVRTLRFNFGLTPHTREGKRLMHDLMRCNHSILDTYGLNGWYWAIIFSFNDVFRSISHIKNTFIINNEVSVG